MKTEIFTADHWLFTSLTMLFASILHPFNDQKSEKSEWHKYFFCCSVKVRKSNMAVKHFSKSKIVVYVSHMSDMSKNP